MTVSGVIHPTIINIKQLAERRESRTCVCDPNTILMGCPGLSTTAEKKKWNKKNKVLLRGIPKWVLNEGGYDCFCCCKCSGPWDMAQREYAGDLKGILKSHGFASRTHSVNILVKLFFGNIHHVYRNVYSFIWKRLVFFHAFPFQQR